MLSERFVFRYSLFYHCQTGVVTRERLRTYCQGSFETNVLDECQRIKNGPATTVSTRHDKAVHSVY